jgi:hypothetical protein
MSGRIRLLCAALVAAMAVGAAAVTPAIFARLALVPVD